MTINTSLVAQRQIPEHIRDNYDIFVLFVKAYYKFLDENYYQNLKTIHEIDEANALFIDLINNFQFEFARYFPISLLKSNKALVMRHLKDFYLSRGSENSFKFLFNILFNDTIQIISPSSRMLRPSSGQWNQERFISAKLVTGVFDDNITGFYILYESAIEYIPCTRFIKTSSNVVRLYYNTSSSILIKEGTLLRIGNCVLQVIKSPNRLEIETGGMNWQLGQLITITHNSGDGEEDTLAKVVSVDPGGVLKQIEIINHGYNHIDGSLFIISPYPNKPMSSGVDYSYVLNPDGESLTHNLTLTDFVTSVTESIVGHLSTALKAGYDLKYEVIENELTSTVYYYKDINDNLIITPITNPDMYYMYDTLSLEAEYADPAETYNCSIPFSDIIVSQTIQETQIDYGITMEEWMASNARVKYKFDIESRTRGHWTDDSGKLSNSWIKIQDDYYYQQFSYVIGSNINPSKYIDTIGIVHPAGNIQFREYISTNAQKLSSGFNISSSRLSYDTLTNTTYNNNAFVISIETKTRGESVRWPASLPQGGSISCIIDWGDGAKSKINNITSINTSDAIWNHTYVLPGKYDIVITELERGVNYKLGAPKPVNTLLKSGDTNFFNTDYPLFQGKVLEIKQWGNITSSANDWHRAFIGCDNPNLKKPGPSDYTTYIESFKDSSGAVDVYDRTIFSPNNFIMTIETSRSNQVFSFPYRQLVDLNVPDPTIGIIWWGDGTMSHITSYYGGAPISLYNHTYAQAGQYKIMVTGIIGAPMFYKETSSTNSTNSRATSAAKLISIDNWGKLNSATNWSNAFRSCGTPAKPIIIKAKDTFGFDVTDISNMFRDSYFVFATDDGVIDINEWNTSFVKNMSGLFMNTTFNKDISNWITSNVEDMSWMFAGNTMFNYSLNTRSTSWNVARVKNMSHMFDGATSFNGDITNWIPLTDPNVNSVTNMQGMFKNASAFNQPIGNWDVSKVTDMSWMFAGATSFNQSIATWDTKSVIDMDHMFYSET